MCLCVCVCVCVCARACLFQMETVQNVFVNMLRSCLESAHIVPSTGRTGMVPHQCGPLWLRLSLGLTLLSLLSSPTLSLFSRHPRHHRHRRKKRQKGLQNWERAVQWDRLTHPDRIWLFFSIMTLQKLHSVMLLNWHQVVRLESVYRGNVLHSFKSISDSQSEHPTNVSNPLFLLLPTAACYCCPSGYRWTLLLTHQSLVCSQRQDITP